MPVPLKGRCVNARILSVCLVAVTFVLLGPGPCPYAESPEQVLDALRGYDATVLQDFVIAGQMAPALTLDQTDSARPLLDLRITRSQDTWGARLALGKEQEPPTYVAPTQRQQDFHERPSSSNDSSEIVVRPNDVSLLADKQFWGERHNNRVYVVSPAGVKEETISPDNIEMRPARDPLCDWRMYVPVFCSGRGYSDYLDTVTSVERQGNILRVTGAGSYPAAARQACSWELEIDPETAYLVRKAKASWPDGRIIAEMENQGALWVEKGPIAQTGRLRAGGDRAAMMYQGDGYFDVAFTAFNAGADHQMLRQLYENFNGNFPENSHVTDFRNDKKPLMYNEGFNPPPTDLKDIFASTASKEAPAATPQHNESSTPAPDKTQATATTKWYLAMGAVACLAAMTVTVLLWRYRTRRNASSRKEKA